MKTFSLALVAALALLPAPAAEPPAAEAALAHSVEQLRASIGRWNVVTEFLKEDGNVAKKVTGTYEFAWVVPDRVASGKTEIPEMKQTSAILFYVNESKSIIEMASVGPDGKLWIMTGPLGGETRTSQAFPTQEGGTAQLRFTRSAVTPDTFESRMEYTEDGGKTWKPGNHQLFRRAGAAAK
jgi:hypothetical protein